jgi:hypothetical protein
MPDGLTRRAVRQEAELLCELVDRDLIALATFFRRYERRGLDQKSISDDALRRLQHVAELVASARAAAEQSIAEGDIPGVTPELPRSDPRILGSPLRLE